MSDTHLFLVRDEQVELVEVAVHEALRRQAGQQLHARQVHLRTVFGVYHCASLPCSMQECSRLGRPLGLRDCQAQCSPAGMAIEYRLNGG